MSTVGPALLALRDLFDATFDDTVWVKLGKRITIDDGIRDRLWIGDATGTFTPGGLGPSRPVTEEYDISCDISVTRQGSVEDQEAVTLRAIELWEGAEHALSAVPGQNLGIPAIEWAAVSGGWGFKEATASETKGPISTSLQFNVHVRALFRLT
jgi:hypothetical protein